MHIATKRIFRLGAGLAAMAIVLALVLVMGTFGGSDRASAAGDPDPDFKVVATVIGVNAKATDQSFAIIKIVKEENQKVEVGDRVLWKKQIWIVTARTPADPNDPAQATIDLVFNPCTTQDSTKYPQDEKFVYRAKPCNDGNLGGVSDIVVGSVNTGAGLFYCIVKTDHDTKDNAIKTALQCNIDIEGGGVAPTTNTPPTWGDTCLTLSLRIPPECEAVSALNNELNNPSETGADAIAGPPPPPPYTNLAPSKGLGFFYPAGTCPDPFATGG